MATTSERVTIASLLRVPGFTRLFLASMAGRLPASALGLVLILHVRGLTGSFAAGGAVAGAYALANGVTGPLLGRLVDRRGQGAVLVPAALASSAAIVAIALLPHGAAVAPAVAPAGSFVEGWGRSGKGDGQFDLTRANGDAYGNVAFGRDGSIYVLDVGNLRVQRFDADRKYLSAWGGFGTGPGQFIDPIGMALDEDGNVNVLDDGRGVVETYTPDGRIIERSGHSRQPWRQTTARTSSPSARTVIYTSASLRPTR